MATIKNNEEIIQLLDTAKYLLRGHKQNLNIQWSIDKINQAIKALGREDEQNPAWNEEDELHIRELESLVKQAWAIAEHENDKETIHKMSNLSFFLKTLKPQPKQEWSEEDEKMLHNIIKDVMILHNSKTIDGLKCKVNWLKSLKNRVQS